MAKNDTCCKKICRFIIMLLYFLYLVYMFAELELDRIDMPKLCPGTTLHYFVPITSFVGFILPAIACISVPYGKHRKKSFVVFIPTIALMFLFSVWGSVELFGRSCTSLLRNQHKTFTTLEIAEGWIIALWIQVVLGVLIILLPCLCKCCDTCVGNLKKGHDESESMKNKDKNTGIEKLEKSDELEIAVPVADPAEDLVPVENTS